jgi:hypothetical protein
VKLFGKTNPRSKNKTVKIKDLPIRLLVITFCLAFISLTFSFQTIRSQVKPLTLAQVLTGLQSTSGNFTLAQKNDFITKRVQANGVTFRLTPEIEKEMKQAGASTALITAIRLKGPKTRPTPVPNTIPDDEKPNADYEKIWVEQNVMQDGLTGIRINATFNVYNLKGVDSDIVYRFEKDGVLLKSKNDAYSTSTGDLSVRRYLTPLYSATVYEGLTAFLPYKEIPLSSGVHNLKMDADVILRNGTIVKHLVLQDLRLTIPSPTSPTLKKSGSATLDKLWVDFNYKQNGVAGLLIHVKMTVRNMKDEDAYLQVLFTKQDDTPLKSSNPTYRSQSGQTAAFAAIRPVAETTNFNDLTVFIPFDEFNLPVGKYTLKMHADLIYPDYSLLSHLGYQSFTYNRSR